MPIYNLAAVFLGMFLSSVCVAHAQPHPIKVTEFTSQTPGTYKTVTTRSQQDCYAVCESEWPQCRGVIAYQEDITKPVFECRLNDGNEAASPFAPETPDPLDMKRALADLNNYRAQYNLAPLTLNAQLTAASLAHAKDLAEHGVAAHKGSDGSTHADRLRRAGYAFSFSGENVATGQKTWDEVFKAWQDSPGHNENLLQDDVSHFGIALIFEPDTAYITYWTMLVAEPLQY